MDETEIRVLVVDDTVTYRKIVSSLLSGVPGITVVGTAANGKIAMNKIDLLRPDMLTLDLEMPQMGGLQLLRCLRATDQDVGVIIISGTSEQGANATMEALNLGAADFVAKPAGSDTEENVSMLRKELVPKIQAFARKRYIREMLHGHRPPPTLATESLPETASDATVDGWNHPRTMTSGAEVVGVGISTGGPQALNRVIPQLPADLAAPVLIVQHMPPIFTKSMAEDLDKRSPLSVSEAVDGQTILPGHVLIAPGGRHMKVVIEDGSPVVRITDDPPENSCRPAVDYLFRSLARVYGPAALGVIMTGMGYDGALGCRQMKQRGATIVAQDEASCVVFGMPRKPIEEGIADTVVPLERIPREIIGNVTQGGRVCT